MTPEETPSSPDVRTGYVKGNTFGYKPVKYSVVDGMALFEGDIILGTVEEMERLAREVEGKAMERGCILPGNQFRWPGNTVPFTIAAGFPDTARVTDAVNHWNNNTDLRLVARTNQANFVTFTTGSGCSSSVGMRGGQQYIRLESGCTGGNAIHEIGHTIGLWHEQSREDRDRFVRIHPENIQDGFEHNFDQHISDGDDVGPYDYGSIMHYPADAFSKNGLDTIETLHGEAIGQRTALSSSDVAAVNLMYPVTLDDTSISGPALAYWNGRLYIAWTGTDGEHHLNVMSSADGKVFDNKVTLGDTSIARPALAVYNGKLHIAWTGTDSGHHLNVMSSANGIAFGNKRTLGETSRLAPALAQFGNALYIAWTGTDSQRRLNVMRYTDAAGWGNKTTLVDTSPHGPALASGGGWLYLGWTGTDSDHKLNVIRSNNGVSWAGKVTLGDTSIAGPALKYIAGRLYIAWTGTDSLHRLNVMTSANGQNFSGKATSGHTSPYTPALSEGRFRAFMGWTGTDSRHRLNVMTI